MASPKRKPKGRLWKKRGVEPCCSHRRRQTITRRRPRTSDRVNIKEILCRMLSMDKHNQERKKQGRISSRDGRFRARNRRESSYDSSPFHESSPSIQESEYTKSAATSVDDLPSFMKARPSSRASSSENSSVSNVSVEPITLANTVDNTRALLKKKSLVQVINNYIKAGIEEGKRQAKKYIRKALSFGVKSGYLIPTDARGQVIRVSPALIDMRKTDAESRRKRRKARKGEDEDPFVETRTEKRKATPPRVERKQPRRADVSRPETPPKKRRKIADKKRSGSPKKKVAEKKGTRGRTEEKRRTRPRKSAKTRNNVRSDLSMRQTVSMNTSEESLQRSAHELTERRLRRAKSPHPKRQEAENSRRSRTISSDEEKSNQRFKNNGMNEATLSIGRRRSATSRDSLRNSNNAANPGNSMRQPEEKSDPPDENKEINVIGNFN